MIKSFIAFKLDAPVQITNLEAFPCPDIGETEISVSGFVPVLGEFVKPITNVNTQAVKLRIIERKIPAAGIKRLLAKKVAEIEERDARKVGKKEQSRLKDEIIFAQLPKILPVEREIFGFISETHIYVGTSSEKDAERLLNSLRLAIGSLAVHRALITDQKVLTELARTNGCPDDLKITGKAKMIDGDGGSLSAQNTELYDSNIQELLTGGYTVTSLGLSRTINEDASISFELNESGVVKSIKFPFAEGDDEPIKEVAVAEEGEQAPKQASGDDHYSADLFLVAEYSNTLIKRIEELNLKAA